MAGPFGVVILGDGVAGWTAGALLAGALPASRYTVTVVPTGRPDDSLGAFGPVEATLPSTVEFHLRLGLDEEALVRDAGAGYALGTAWSGWAPGAATFFVPYGDVGAALDTVPFPHLAQRLRTAGGTLRLSDFSLAALAAQMGRFARPSADPASVLSTYSYGLNLPRDSYARALRELALARGAGFETSRFVSAALNEDGNIESLQLEDGSTVAGALFIDASGAAGELIEGELSTGFESWRRWLPCDQVTERVAVTPVPPAPYSHFEALPSGWRRTVPAQGAMGEAEISCSGVFQVAGATRFESGRRERAWNRNCIALGAAAATLEPLDSTSLPLVQSALTKLLMLFPSGSDRPAEAAEFNRQWAEELDRLRDFAILPYKLNGRRGEPFWDAVRDMTVPEPLAHKIALYESRGRVPLLDGDMFEEAEWTLRFDSFGRRPRRYDPRADALPLDRIERHFAAIRSVMLRAAASLPVHADYLAQPRQARESAA